jgi:2-phosphosulfolactate phosphatase
MPQIDAVALPDHLSEHQLDGKIAVVIDVLRATTTIVEALGNGARSVVPVASVDGARVMAHEQPDALLCGERSGVKPEGFSLGNSPLEYTPATIRNTQCVFSTTNGTRALHMATQADEILVGSITNADALCDRLRQDSRDVMLVCSGTDGKVSFEDCLGAGLIISRLGFQASDNAAMMYHAMKGAIERFGGLRYAVESSFHAKRLIKMGFEGDVTFATQIGTSPIVPVFDSGIGEILAD